MTCPTKSGRCWTAYKSASEPYVERQGQVAGFIYLVQARIEHEGHISEADEGILDMQLEQEEPLTAEEKAYAVVVAQDHPLSISGIRERIDQF